MDLFALMATSDGIFSQTSLGHSCKNLVHIIESNGIDLILILGDHILSIRVTKYKHGHNGLRVRHSRLHGLQQHGPVNRHFISGDTVGNLRDSPSERGHHELDGISLGERSRDTRTVGHRAVHAEVETLFREHGELP